MNQRRGRVARPIRRVPTICGVAFALSLVLGTVAFAPSVNAEPRPASPTIGATRPAVGASPVTSTTSPVTSTTSPVTSTTNPLTPTSNSATSTSGPATPTSSPGTPNNSVTPNTKPVTPNGPVRAAINPVAPTSLTFAPQQPMTSSPPQQLTFTNTTGSAINLNVGFTQDAQGLLSLSGCPSEPALLPGRSCVLTVVFTPPGGGQSADVSIVFNANNGPTLARVPVLIQWLPIVFSPSTPLDLGSVHDGQSSGAATVSLRNFWTVATSVTSVRTTPGSGFTVTGSTCGALPSGATCTVGISYTPGVHVGPATDNLTVSGPWGGSGQETLPLHAVGVAAPLLSVSPTSLGFPTPQQVGTSSEPQTVTVTNVGTSPLRLATPSISPGEVGDSYVITDKCQGGLIAPGKSCQVIVVYRPSGEGVTPRNGDLLLFDVGNHQSLVRVPVTTGLLLPLFFTPPAVTLPPTPIDAVSAPQTISVRNFDTISTTVNGYRLSSPDFEVTEFTCTGPLASGATCQIVVRAHPTKTGPLSGQLVISGPFYGPIASETVALSGTGTSQVSGPGRR
jgi:hypothetical protein